MRDTPGLKLTPKPILILLLQIALLPPRVCPAGQLHDPVDRGQPGDAMIQEYLARETEKIEADFLTDIKTRAAGAGPIRVLEERLAGKAA